MPTEADYYIYIYIFIYFFKGITHLGRVLQLRYTAFWQFRFLKGRVSLTQNRQNFVSILGNAFSWSMS